MKNVDTDKKEDGLPGDKPSSQIRLVEQLVPAAAFELISMSARLLFTNGQTTKKTVEGVEQLANAFGYQAHVFARWGQLTVRAGRDPEARYEIIAAEPAGVDMGKVAATMDVIAQICQGRIDAKAAGSELAAIAARPPVSLVRFALMAGAGAAALAVIFGAEHPLSLVLIALTAGAGACLRRWLAGLSHNLFVQPFCAALLAGVTGAIVDRLQLDSVLRLVAVCPCMVLVPGPHFLNGALDFGWGRIPLGLARIAYASLITLAICVGLLLGLALGDVSLPVSVPSRPVPLGYDVLAAGVAVAAYGSFFNMAWKILSIPIVVGMFAHACRWVAISVAGANPAAGALIACLVVGTIMAPVADRLRLPFAGLAFASVVSLIPGVFLFRMAGGMVQLVALGSQAPLELFSQVFADGTTAVVVVVAMGFGLVAPRLLLESRAPLAR